MQSSKTSDCTWKELLQEGTHTLEQADVAEAGLDARYLLEELTGWSLAQFFLHQEERADQDSIAAYREQIRKRSRHIPLQHLTGQQEFMGLSFQVNEHVLIPRQDTEVLVEKLLPLVSGKRVLDVCTGSGCIAISLAKLGKPLRVDAVDLSREALEAANINAETLAAEVTFAQGDLLQNVQQTYDVIVSNPPYIATETIRALMPEVREHEPMLALDGGIDGLVIYRRLIPQAWEHLDEDGQLWMEIGYDQGESVPALMKECGFDQVHCYQDLAGLDRVVSGVKKTHLYAEDAVGQRKE